MLLAAMLSCAVAQQYYVFATSNTCGNTTIYGLWPEWAEWCGGPPFDPTKLAPLAEQLAEAWPSCVGDDNATAFHAHEWDKHGTCSDFELYDYFANALQLFQQFKAPLTCLERGLPPLKLFPCPHDSVPVIDHFQS